MNRFDLETALATWRQFQENRRAILPDDLDELESHLRSDVARLIRAGLTEEAAFRAAVEELGDLAGGEAEYRKVYWRKLKQNRQLGGELAWRVDMLKNYLKIAYRNLARQKGYALLNVTGLVVGIACCLLIGMYVQHEWSYDAFHTDADQIYRLTYTNRTGHNLPPPTEEDLRAWGSAFFAPRLAADFPEIEQAVRFSGRHQLLFSRGEQRFQEERYLYADSAFFEVFSFPLLRGNPETALRQPGRVVLTETAARRYFGEADPMGQTLQMGSSQQEITVTGVMADLPSNTHLDFDLLLSMATFEQNARANNRGFVFDNWGYVDFFTYVKLNEGASAAALAAKFPAFIERHLGDDLADPPRTYTLALEPITEAYLGPVTGFAIGPKGNPANLYLFSFIGVFILLIACVNFTNLATARAAQRAKEVGVRKTVGARRVGLMTQFLTEAVVLTAVATVLAVVVAYVALPFFRELAGRAFSAAALTGLPMVALLLVGTLLVAGLAGGYPAFVLSAFRPVEVLKGRFATSRRGVLLRQGLVVFQFAAAIALIVGTLVVQEQLAFLQNRSLGFDEEQQLVVNFGGDRHVRENLDALAAALASVPGVQQVSATRSIPGDYFPHATTYVEAPDGALLEFIPGLYEVDDRFLAQLGLAPAAGRLFSEAYTTDAEDALIVNEATMRFLGYADPAELVGKPFRQWGREGQVVGVVRDFNHQSLHHEIRPLTFRVSPWLSYFVLQVETQDAAATVAQVGEVWAQHIPHRPFLYRFLDQSFDAQYRGEARFATLFGIFAGLAIFVACLGLFGLAAFAAQQRTKEIGIRKVLGATVPSLLGLLVKDFLQLVGIAFAVAVPLVWWGMNRWLEGFAYHVEIGVGVFLWAGLITLVIALLTVSYQSVRTALAEPVQSLRYE